MAVCFLSMADRGEKLAVWPSAYVRSRKGDMDKKKFLGFPTKKKNLGIYLGPTSPYKVVKI